MKKWLTLTLLLFCIPALVWGWGTVIISGNASSETICNTLALSYESSGDDDWTFGYGFTDCVATDFTTTNQLSVCKVAVYIRKTGTLSGNVRVGFQSDASGSPSGIWLAVSEWVSWSDIGTTYDWVNFTFPTNVSLSASTTYWLVIDTDTELSADQAYWYRNKTSGPGSNAVCGEIDCDCSSWNTASGRTAYYRIYE